MNAVKISDVEEAEYVFENDVFGKIKSLEHKKKELFEKIEGGKNAEGGFSLDLISADAHELELVIAKLEVLYYIRNSFRNCIVVSEKKL